MDITLFKVAAVFYLFGAGSFILYLLVPKAFLSRLSPFLLLCGLLVHTLALGLHFFHSGYPAVAEFREKLSFYAWVIVAVYLLTQVKYRLTVLGSLIAPLAFLMSLAAFAFGSGKEDIPVGLKSYWLPIHVTLAFLGNAVFALAFAVSLVYLLQEYQLKRKRLNVLREQFPSLETLDHLNYVFLVWGFPLMTLGIITGSMWAGIQWGTYWSWEPREISSMITWLFYGVLLHSRVTGDWRGRKAALLTILGFVVVLGYFLWGDALFPGRHAGRFE